VYFYDMSMCFLSFLNHACIIINAGDIFGLLMCYFPK